MAIVQVQEWLKAASKDFEVGVKLLEEHNPNHARLFVFKLYGNSPAHLRWLNEALLEVVKTDTPAKKSEAKFQHEAPAAISSNDSRLNSETKPQGESTSKTHYSNVPFAVIFEKLSDALKEEYKREVKGRFEERRALNAKFDHRKSEEYNAQISRQLTQVEDILSNYFTRAWHFVETGEEADRSLFGQYKAMDRKVDCHREYIAKNKKKPEKKLLVEERELELQKDLVGLKKLEEELYAKT